MKTLRNHLVKIADHKQGIISVISGNFISKKVNKYRFLLVFLI